MGQNSRREFLLVAASATALLTASQALAWEGKDVAWLKEIQQRPEKLEDQHGPILRAATVGGYWRLLG